MVQHNAALAITCAIKGTSRDRIYQELDSESRATIDPMHSCALEPQTTLHYLLHRNL